MFVDKKKETTLVHTCTHCSHSAGTAHPHKLGYVWACTNTCTRLDAHTHTPLIMEAEKTTCNMLVSPCTHRSQLPLTTHTIIKKTMMRQASCCVFAGLLTISQLADQQTKAVIFRAGLLCIITKDRVWWHLTKQPVRRVSYFQTVAVIKDKICH